MISKEKIRRNLRAVDNAIAQQRLEGLEVPSDVVRAMQQVARGEMGMEEGIRSTVRKFAHDEISGHGPLS